MEYGTCVDRELHRELLDRLSALDMPKVVGFITPVLVEDQDDVRLIQPDDFLEQQLQLHRDYVLSATSTSQA